MADLEIAEINEQFEKKQKSIKNSKSFVKDTKKKTIKRINKLKKSGNDKLLHESTVKLSKVKTMKTKEKYIKKVIALSETIVSDYAVMREKVENGETEIKDMKEKYNDFKDAILKHLSQEKRKVAQIRGDNYQGIFLYGESEIGSRITNGNSDSIFNSKFLNDL